MESLIAFLFPTPSESNSLQGDYIHKALKSGHSQTVFFFQAFFFFSNDLSKPLHQKLFTGQNCLTYDTKWCTDACILFSLLICFLIYLGIVRAEEWRREERAQRITVVQRKGASRSHSFIVYKGQTGPLRSWWVTWPQTVGPELGLKPSDHPEQVLEGEMDKCIDIYLVELEDEGM